MGNIVKAIIGKNGKDIKTAPLYQYDYGQILKIEGIELPTTYQVHFSNDPTGTSTTSVGNADGVEIPDVYLTSGDTVYAWLYLHTGEDDGETVLKIEIPVKRRAEITNQTPTPQQQSEIDQLIGELNAAVDAAEDAQDAAEQAAEQAEAQVEHYPVIVDGYWAFWDEETEQYVKSNQKAQGPQGEPGDPTELIDDTTPAANKTFSSSKVDDELTRVKSEIQEKPEVKDSTKTGVDLDVADEDGNVLVRFSDGNIKTKKFDSEKASETKNSSASGIDLDIADKDGNVIARLINGQIQTKKFNSAIVNDWFGAVYCSHGDSITWQDGKAYAQGQHIGEIARGYQTILKEKLSLSSYNNQGKSGWSMAVVNSNGIVNTIKAISDYTQYDLVTIAVGTNDFKLNVSIGTLGVIGDTTFDDTKFFGAYRDAIEYILTNSPKTRIVLMTPLQRDNDGYDVNYTNSAGHKLIDYVEAVEAIGEMYGLPVCDMFRDSGFTKKTLSTYTMDGLHPNDEGYERMGNYLTHFVMNVGK